MGEIWEGIKNFVLTTLGHGVSGAVVSAMYEVTRLVGAGIFELKAVAFGVTLGACIGFFKVVIEEIEKAREAGSLKTSVAKKTGKAYFI